MRMSARKTLIISAILGMTFTAFGSPVPGNASAPATTAGLTAPAAASLTGSATGLTAPLAKAAPYCGITWGSGDKTAGPLSVSPLVAVRTGRHECWDRVVFEFDGAVQGYSVRYSTQVPTDGEGLDLAPYTAGGAHLWVSLRAPAYDGDHVATFHARTGEHVATAARYDTLRDVVFGGSFEGYTTFAVGVRARLPFRVQLLSGPGTHSRIVVDIAHRW